MNKKYILLTITIFVLVQNVFSQTVPAEAQSKDIAITEATIHIGNGTMISKGTIIFSKGKISYVGTNPTINDNTIQIQAQGKHVYPGFIATNSSIGLQEIEQVKATNDENELGEFNANVRSIIAYNTDSKVLPTLRSNGVLLAQVVPQGGRISGQSSIVQLDAWNWEDALVSMDQGIHLRWPYFNRPQSEENKSNSYNKQIQSIKDFFDEAFAYQKTSHESQKNLRYEAMRGLWQGTKKLFIHTSAAKTIQHAVNFANQYGLKVVIVGAEESWRITDFLKANQTEIVLSETHNLPFREDDDYDQPFKTPRLLQAAGIPFCLGLNGFWQQRNLPYQAGQAVALGLDYEQAVQMISLAPAKILGIDQYCGSLEPGKDANIIISNGDVLDMKSHEIIRAFIQGREIDLNNVHKELYNKFNTKYQRINSRK